MPHANFPAHAQSKALRRHCLGGLLAAGLLLGGCAETGARLAALHLHDIGNETAARNAKTAFDKAKLRELLNAEPENQKKLLDRELKAVAGYLGAIRDLTLQRAIGGSLPLHDVLVDGTLAEGFRQLGIRVGASEIVATDLAQQLKDLDLPLSKPIVAGDDVAQTILALGREIRRYRDRMANAARLLGETTVQPLAWCSEDLPDKPPSSLWGDKKGHPTESESGYYAAYADSCDRYLDFRTALELVLKAIEIPTPVLSVAASYPLEGKVRQVFAGAPVSLAQCLAAGDLYAIERPELKPAGASLPAQFQLPRETADDQVLVRRRELRSVPEFAGRSRPRAERSDRMGRAAAPASTRVPYPKVREQRLLDELLGYPEASSIRRAAARVAPPSVATAEARRAAPRADAGPAPVDPQVRGLIDLEDCLQAIAPQRLVLAVRRLHDEEEKYGQLRQDVVMAQAAYARAVAAAKTAGEKEDAARKEVERNICRLYQLMTAERGVGADGSESKQRVCQDYPLKASDAFVDLAKTLKDAGHPLPQLVQQFLTEERLTQIDGKLTTLLTRQGADAGTPAAEPSALRKASDALLESTFEQMGLASLPALRELAIQREYQAVLKDQALASLDRWQRRMRLREDQVNAAFEELALLQAARGEALNIGGEGRGRDIGAGPCPTASTHPACKPLIQALDKANPLQDRWRIARILVGYADTVQVARLRYEHAEQRLVGLANEAVVGNSGLSLRLFEASIAGPIDDLIAFHASGYTPQEIANALLALGLTVGVNR